MFRFLRRLSIQRKLIAVTGAAGCAAQLLTCLVYFSYQSIQMQKNLRQDMSAVASVLASSSTAVLIFHDRKAALANLQVAQRDSRFAAAAVYDQRGRLFAACGGDGPSALPVPKVPRSGGSYRNGEYVELFEPIVHEGERIGTVYLQADYRRLGSGIRRFFWISGGIAVSGMLLILFLSFHLQRIISRPILPLPISPGVSRVNAAITSGPKGDPATKWESSLTPLTTCSPPSSRAMPRSRASESASRCRWPRAPPTS